jgi:hypothetical protein
MYEIGNEVGPYSTEWQYHMIRFVKEQEKKRGRQPLVGMTFQFKGGSNADLFRSPADWVSPNPDGGYRDDPPVPEGKVLVADTDHLWGIGGNAAWAWKAFMRGQHPVYMDPYDAGTSPFGGKPDLSVRTAISQVAAWAEKVDLAAMTPHGELASTDYCLANPGREYLVYVPDGGEASVDLSALAGGATVAWFNCGDGTTVGNNAGKGGGRRDFQAPFAGAAVLYIRAR